MNGIRVLVVEDEVSFIEALQVGLEREGFTVEIAKDGSEALIAFEKFNPDLILLDLMLPKISGIDVCRQIRSRSDVPIIMVTAKGEEIDTVVGLEVGADDYVSKPYRLKELVARMRTVIRRVQKSNRSTNFTEEQFSTISVGDVEVYVENKGEEHHSTGVYSVSDEAWVAHPEQIDRVVDLETALKKRKNII